MKTLVTGANGFIGKKLVKKLLSRGFEVISLVRHKSNLIEGCVQIVCDLENDDIPGEALKDVECIFHLAGISTDADSGVNEKKYQEVNCEAARKLAEKAVRFHISTFIFISSVKACGYISSDRCLTETDQKDPVGLYAKSKRLAEMSLLQIDKKTSYK